jgi:hypothetical protein
MAGFNFHFNSVLAVRKAAIIIPSVMCGSMLWE